MSYRAALRYPKFSSKMLKIDERSSNQYDCAVVTLFCFNTECGIYKAIFEKIVVFSFIWVHLLIFVMYM